MRRSPAAGHIDASVASKASCPPLESIFQILYIHFKSWFTQMTECCKGQCCNKPDAIPKCTKKTDCQKSDVHMFHNVATNNFGSQNFCKFFCTKWQEPQFLRYEYENWHPYAKVNCRWEIFRLEPSFFSKSKIVIFEKLIIFWGNYLNSLNFGSLCLILWQK